MGRTPRELLGAVTSEEITEAMAFERMEPFGALHLEAVIGELCAVMANAHFKPPSDGERWLPRHFMGALNETLNHSEPAQAKPFFIDDPEQMSAFIRARFPQGGPKGH